VKLIHSKNQQVLCSQIDVAQSLKSRLVGLIGTKKLEQRGLWIPRCYWIHTFFMSIPIDVIYLDKKGTICDMNHELKPWKLPRPVFSASDVVELPAGFIRQTNLKVGDTLHVGH
jgi:hypothetical protein